MKQICQILWCPLFRVHRDIHVSSRHNCENYDCWWIGHHRYIRMYGWRTRLVFLLLSCNSFWTNSASYEYKNKSANIGAQFVPIGISNALSEDLVAKDYIYIVYKKLMHTLNVCFGVLVWAIRVVSQKILSCFPITRNLYFWVPCLFKRNPIIYNLKEPRPWFAVRNCCTKCGEIMRFDAVNFRKTMRIQFS
jgi:hypothetical protein